MDRDRLRFAMLFSTFLAAVIIVFVFWGRDAGGAVLLASGWFLFDWGVLDLILRRDDTVNVAVIRLIAGGALIALGILRLI